MELDVPMLWDYMSEVLAPIFVDLSENRKSFISEVIKYCEELNKRAIFVAKIFKVVAELTVRKGLFCFVLFYLSFVYNLLFTFVKSEAKAYELWFESDLNWKDFLPLDENIEKFVEQNVS